jgi:hypothetical protein
MRLNALLLLFVGVVSRRRLVAPSLPQTNQKPKSPVSITSYQ